jgi:hypothetical protein
LRWSALSYRVAFEALERGHDFINVEQRGASDFDVWDYFVGLPLSDLAIGNMQ